ncbi:MAG TPA: alanine--tRNA ligase [Bacillota bacterium]|nr:alanine--tRNA ligase [Bacillota bacterium]
MEKIGLNELRSMFQEFYQGKDHYARKSFSLIPEKDKSLLIINSGMAPLKPYFAGLETPPSKRMTTCQKCIRTGDIENVGYTARHGTFFEMLGSFSFGDYFKVESLTWGWEFITQVLKMPEDKLWATIYEEDQEAHDIWRDVIGLPEERIVPLGKDDNFWEIGTGPCGPCSEIYFDRGEKYGCGKPDCKPGCDCDRYVEFWNHVFTQFNRDEAGNYTPLSHPNIDTGMGLERLACIMQDVDSIFNVDTIQYILKAIVKLSGVPYQNGEAKTDVSIRIITDHIRSVTFMIADGILPSNEGRGYVLRRLLRRAARHGKLLGIQGAFLADLSEKVIEVSGSAYPELSERREYIHKILSVEEDKFSSTIDQGTSIISDYVKELKAAGKTVLSGDKVFKLYDTYGFPLELTQEILEENGCTADVEGFNENMLHQKEQARAARKAEEDEGWSDDAVLFIGQEPTEFTGYDTLSSTAGVKGLFRDRQPVSKLAEGETGILLLDKTPFYAESGGQASDIGTILGKNGTSDVLSVSKAKGFFAHKITVKQGGIQTGEEVTAQVSAPNRNNTARNHTATHILHKALREVLGAHVEQAGSNVTSEGLRFDFTHFEAISKDDLQKIESIVNEKIDCFLPVKTEIMSIEDAMKTGAMALFGEKYGDTVRVISVGDYSTELCGGTHITNSGQIGAFRILSENGVAAGVRRIEAVTGAGLYRKLRAEEDLVHSAAEALKTNVSGLISRIASVSEELKATKKELEDLKKQSMSSGLNDMITNAKEINGVRLITNSFKDVDINELRGLSDEIKAENKGVIIVFAAENSGKVTFMVSVSDDLLERGYHAGNMIKKIAAAAGGGGGGKADMAQAGAKDPSRIKEALDLAATLI